MAINKVIINNKRKLLIAIFTAFLVLSLPLTEIFAGESLPDFSSDSFNNLSESYNLNTPITLEVPDLLSERTGSVERKDPFVAGLLSWFMMGIGQIYCKEYTRGSLFIALDLVDKTAMVLLISYINTKYTPGEGEIIYLNWKAFDNSTKLLVVSYVLAKIGLRFYNVVDAINSAYSYNSRYGSDRGKKESFDFKIGKNEVGFGYKIGLK